MKLKRDFKKIWEGERIQFAIVFIVLGLLSYFVSNHKPDIPMTTPPEIIQLDSLIPEGFVLLPLDFVNREALSSIVGSTAVIDLFTVNSQTLNPSKKIASKVKIIRTPRDPNQFAILIRESETNQVLNDPGPYFAVVQNKTQARSRWIKKPPQQDVQISYQE